MLRASISFFIIGLIAYFLGANNIAGLSIEFGRIILIIFLILAVISFVTTMVTGKKNISKPL